MPDITETIGVGLTVDQLNSMGEEGINDFLTEAYNNAFSEQLADERLLNHLVPTGFDFSVPLDGPEDWKLNENLSDRILDNVDFSEQLADERLLKVNDGAVDPFTGETVGVAQDYTLGDEVKRYIELDDEQRKELAERLYSNSFYSKSVDKEEILRPADMDAAFRNALQNYGRRGLSVLDKMEIGDGPITRTTEPWSDAYSKEITQQAARSIFGRNALADEERLAMKIIKDMEAQGKAPNPLDVRHALRSDKPEEVRQVNGAKTMRNLLSIVQRGSRL